MENNIKKNFVNEIRQIREEISKEIQALTPEQIRVYYKEKLAELKKKRKVVL